jgi:hypothetical protein
VQAGEFPSRRARPSLVFVAENGVYKPRIVRLGVANYDYTEVLGGLKEGEQVALLAAAAMQAKREEQNNRIRSMGGLPGMSQPRPGGAAGGAGAVRRRSGSALIPRRNANRRNHQRRARRSGEQASLAAPMLGIVIGVSAVIAMIALGNGARRR